MTRKRKGATGDAHRVTAARRRAAVLERRMAGQTFEEIAAALGYSNRSGAYRAFQRAVAEVTAERAAEMRSLEGARMDAALVGIWNRIQNYFLLWPFKHRPLAGSGK